MDARTGQDQVFETRSTARYLSAYPAMNVKRTPFLSTVRLIVIVTIGWQFSDVRRIIPCSGRHPAGMIRPVEHSRHL